MERCGCRKSFPIPLRSQFPTDPAKIFQRRASVPNLAAFLRISRFNTVPLLAVLALGDAQFVRFPAALRALAILFLLRRVLLRLFFAPFFVLNRIACGAVSVSHILTPCPTVQWR